MGGGGSRNGRYVTSNSNITLEDRRSVPIGDRFVRFKTLQGRQVTAFGILYGCEFVAAGYEGLSC